MPPPRAFLPFLLLLAALSGSCASHPDYRAAWAAYQRPPHVILPAHPVVIALWPAGAGRLYVTAEFGGAARRLMVDTGASLPLILDARVVAATGVPTLAAPPRVLTGASGAVDARVCRLPRIELGGATLQDCPAIVTDLREWNRGEVLPIDGILGGGLLALLRARIDYSTATLTLPPS